MELGVLEGGFALIFTTVLWSGRQSHAYELPDAGLVQSLSEQFELDVFAFAGLRRVFGPDRLGVFEDSGANKAAFRGYFDPTCKSLVKGQVPKHVKGRSFLHPPCPLIRRFQSFPPTLPESRTPIGLTALRRVRQRGL